MREKSQRLIILDRDGVINKDSPDYIKSTNEWVPITGSIDAIARLYRAGFKVVVATNQSGLSRGLFTIETLLSIHQKMLDLVKDAGGHIDGIFFSPAGPRDGSRCRKPAIGLLEQISRRFRIDLKGVPMVGDSKRDLECYTAVQGKSILVRTGNGEETLKHLPEFDGVTVFSDLSATADSLIEQR